MPQGTHADAVPPGADVAGSRRTTPAGRFVLAARVRSEEPAAFLLRTLSAADNTVIAEEDFFTLDPAVGYGIFALEFELDESRLLRHELVKGDDSTLLLLFLLTSSAILPLLFSPLLYSN